MRKPSPYKRIIADLVDGVILIAVKLLFAGAFFIVSDKILTISKGSRILCITLWVFYLITITLIFFIYYIYFFSKYGSSPGKLFFNLRIVDDRTGGPLSKKQAFLRALGYLISGAPVYLGFFWILFDPKGQGWHDKIAGTRMTSINEG